jgi:hypothetical protein
MVKIKILYLKINKKHIDDKEKKIIDSLREYRSKNMSSI